MATRKSISVGQPTIPDKWQAEDDMRTLARAKEIEADRKRMAAAQKMAEQKIKEMQSVVAKKPAIPARKR